ncbi:MAG TPA: TRAP transporter small permease subunit [Burkholderiaceae bacterium]|nr:TRAP transporter small permease subunit [Burkholderiaceae bacterium]
MTSLQVLDRWVGRVLHGVSAACLALLLLLVGLMVLNRLAGIASLGWTDEIVELLFAWMVFVGTAAVWRAKGHFCVDALLVSIASPRRRQLLALVIAVANFGCLAVLAWLSLGLTLDAGESSPVFAVSKAWWYGVMPAMLAVMCVYSLRDIVVAAQASFPRQINDYRIVCD